MYLLGKSPLAASMHLIVRGAKTLIWDYYDAERPWLCVRPDKLKKLVVRLDIGFILNGLLRVPLPGRKK